HIRFTRAKIAAFYRVVEQPVNAVAIVLIVLRGVDSTLRRNAVGPARTVLKAEALDVVTELRKRCGSGRAGQTRSDNNNVVLSLVGRVHQLQFEAVTVPS